MKGSCAGMQYQMRYRKKISLTVSYRELLERLRNVDVIGVDVDSCLIKGHGQLHIAFRLLPEILVLGSKRFPRTFIEKVIWGAGGFFLFHMKKYLSSDRFNVKIMECFSKTLKGVPRASFDEAVRSTIRFIRPGACEAVNFLLDFAPVVFLSLGIEPVARAFIEYSGLRERDVPTPVIANMTVFRENGSNTVFDSISRESLISDGKAKLESFMVEMEKIGARCPMVVGHDENDIYLSHWVRSRGGITVGFCPAKRFENAFDVIIRSGSWEDFVAFFREVARNTRICACWAEKEGSKID